jgi:hypothetical protein
MKTEHLGLEEIEALTSARLGDMRKKINAASWTDNMEVLMKHWGEKAAGLRFMHSHTGGKWKKFSDNLSISGILVTGVASTLSLIATNVTDDNIKNGFLYGIGGIGLLSTLIQSFKKFYNAEEKAAEHNMIAKQFGSYYRKMTLQMGMSRFDRNPSDVLTTWALDEYERLQQDAPSISGNSITLFKNNFKDKDQCFPDIAEDHFIINIYKEDTKREEDETTEEKLDKETETELEKTIEKKNELINKVNENSNSEIEMTNNVE